MIRLLVTLALGASLLPAQLFPPAPGQKPLSWVTVTASPSGNCVQTTQGQLNVVNGTAWACVTGNASLINGAWTQVSGGGGGGAVASVFGRTGAVIAVSGDYAATQVTNAASTAAPNTFGAFAQTFLGNLLFGGTSASFPGLRRSGTSLDVILADASDFADFRARTLTVQQNININGMTLFWPSSTATAGALTNDGTGHLSFIPGGGGGTATSIQAGVLGSLPGTCAAGVVYFATNQPAGEQLYQCDSTNHFTQTFLHDSTLVNTSGSFGVNPAQFCQITNSCTVSSFWNFTGAAATAPNKSGLFSAIPGTCTIGQTYFATDATAGANIYSCTASNTWTPPSGGGNVTQIVDSNSNPTVKSDNAVTSAVNYILATNAVTGNPPTLSPGGSDANINLNLTYKGIGSNFIGGNSSGATNGLSAITVYDHATTTSGAVRAGVRVDIPSITGDEMFQILFNGTPTWIWDVDGGTGSRRMRTVGGGLVIDILGNITSGGTIQAAGYKSSDGSAGVTGSTCSSFKNGLCVAP